MATPNYGYEKRQKEIAKKKKKEEKLKTRADLKNQQDGEDNLNEHEDGSVVEVVNDDAPNA